MRTRELLNITIYCLGRSVSHSSREPWMTSAHCESANIKDGSSEAIKTHTTSVSETQGRIPMVRRVSTLMTKPTPVLFVPTEQ